MKIQTAILLAIAALSGCVKGEDEAPAQAACSYSLSPISVQISDMTLGPEDSDRVAALSGTVVRSFSGPYAVGDRVSVDLLCSGDSPLMGFGGTWYECASFAASPVVELGMREYEGELRLVDLEGGATGILTLDAATDEAQFRIPGVCVVG